MGPGATPAGAVRPQGLHELRESELGQLRRFWGDPQRVARSLDTRLYYDGSPGDAGGRGALSGTI